MNSVKVVMMCGGIGKRMSPLTTDKALLEFNGIHLIMHQVNSALESGISEFIVITNPENNDQIAAALTKVKKAKIDFVLQQKPLGMANAILSASHFIEGNPFILVSSNDIFDTSAYSTLLSEYGKNENYSVYITAKQVQNYFPGGYLVVNEQNEISHIIEKPAKGQEPSNLINIVLHLHTQPNRLINYLTNTKSSTDDIYELSLDRMIKDGQKVKAVPYHGYWQAIKYPWHILMAMDHFTKQENRQISSTATISDKAIVEGNTLIEDNVRVFEGAVIRGNNYIGRNSIIGTGCLIRDSIIGDDCVVGYGTEIKRSYIGNKCWFHSNYIGDSIIEDNCSFGAGAVTANFRLDETNIKIREGNTTIDTETDKLGAIVGRDCRIGIHASLMPGIRIGANTFIGSHVYLTSDIEANKKVLAESQYRILNNDSSLNDNKKRDLFNKLTN